MGTKRNRCVGGLWRSLGAQPARRFRPVDERQTAASSSRSSGGHPPPPVFEPYRPWAATSTPDGYVNFLGASHARGGLRTTSSGSHCWRRSPRRRARTGVELGASTLSTSTYREPRRTSSSPRPTCSRTKVKRVCVGRRGRGNETRLRALFGALGWKCAYDNAAGGLGHAVGGRSLRRPGVGQPSRVGPCVTAGASRAGRSRRTTRSAVLIPDLEDDLASRLQ